MSSILRKGAIGLVLVCMGVLAGNTIPPASTALGEVRTPPAQPFQSGSQLSLPLLKEIAATLHQMDSRLARLEIAAQKLQAGRPATPAGN